MLARSHVLKGLQLIPELHLNPVTILTKMSEPYSLQYTKAIVRYTQGGFSYEALKLFHQMQSACLKPNHVAFTCVLIACAKLGLLHHGQSMQALILKNQIKSDVSVYNALVTMYGKCQRLNDAVRVFERIPNRDLVSWNTIIAAYGQSGKFTEAIDHYSHLQHEGLKPDSKTFTSVLSSLAVPEAIEQGKQVHTHIIKIFLFQLDVPIANALVTMYCKCGDLKIGRKVFDKMPQRNVVSWTAIIAGYAQNELGYEALSLFSQLQSVGIAPNALTFASVLKGCGNTKVLGPGKQIQALVLKSGLLESNMYISSALVDMYAKCGSMYDAEKAFRRLPRHDAVSWTAMIGGYVQNGFGVEALELFCTMRKVDIDPDEFTFSSILTACASLSLEVGKQVHAHVKKFGQELVVTVGNALVTMYSKCGSIDNAQEIFERMVNRNLTSWNSMILACAQHGQCKGAIKLFEQMQTTQVKADGITFLGVLHACCHKGLVAEGRYYFHLMSRDHGIIPREEHYACMVDLLGRAGELIEAEDFINSMPFKPGIMVWQTLLGACTSCGNMELGIRTAEHLLSLDPQDSATYVLLSNIYAAAGRWDDRARVRKLMKDRGVRKEVGCSWIEVNNKVHAFVLDSRIHPQIKGIYE